MLIEAMKEQNENFKQVIAATNRQIASLQHQLANMPRGGRRRICSIM
jgi:hypothetical protein